MRSWNDVVCDFWGSFGGLRVGFVPGGLKSPRRKTGTRSCDEIYLIWYKFGMWGINFGFTGLDLEILDRWMDLSWVWVICDSSFLFWYVGFHLVPLSVVEAFEPSNVEMWWISCRFKVEIQCLDWVSWVGFGILLICGFIVVYRTQEKLDQV